MKKFKKLFSILLVFGMLFAFIGCQSTNEETSENQGERVVTVTDMSGDEVTIEGEVESIINLWPAGTSSFFVMGGGDLITGLANNSPAVMNTWTKYFYPDSVDIPALGGTTPSIEELTKLNPDLVIIHPSTAKDGYAQKIRDVGIPAINMNFSDYESMIEAYTMLGEILGGEYQEKLDAWCDEVKENLDEVRGLTADLTDEEKPVVHYMSAMQDNLTTTMGANSLIIADWIESSGGIFASKEMNLSGSEVTPEALFQLNPDIIMVGGVYQHVAENALKTTDGWKDLKAVTSDKAYTNPYGCFNWDRFGMESLLQIHYSFMRIQPELAEENGINEESMVKEIMDFYKTYTGVEMTEEEAQNMFDGLGPDGSMEYPVQ